MTTLWVVWVVAAAAILVVGGLAGLAVKGTPTGLLIDERDRYSLNRFQFLWWLWIILSMAAGVAAVRFTVPNAKPLGFSVPGPVLGLLGTVGGTTVASSAVKAYRDRLRRDSVAAALPGSAFLGQMLLQEEGAGADQALDVGKFQVLVITVFLGAAYVLTAVYDFIGRDSPPITTPDQITALPGLDPTFVALLAISSGSYVGTKLIGRSGAPPFSLTDRDQLVQDVLAGARADGSAVDGRRLRALLRKQPGGRAADVRRNAPPQQVGAIPLGATGRRQESAGNEDPLSRAHTGVPFEQRR